MAAGHEEDKVAGPKGRSGGSDGLGKGLATGFKYWNRSRGR